VGSLGAGVAGGVLISYASWDAVAFLVASGVLFFLSIPLIDMHEKQTKKHDA